MNNPLKQKIEEAAERRGFSAGLGERWEAEESFKAGAQFLLGEGVRFSEEDMVEFAEWFSRNWGLDFKADQGLEVWLKERGKHEQRVKK